MIEENKWNEYEEENKNNLLILNLFFIFLHFFFPSTFPLFFLFLTFSSNFLRIKHNIFYKVLQRKINNGSTNWNPREKGQLCADKSVAHATIWVIYTKNLIQSNVPGEGYHFKVQWYNATTEKCDLHPPHAHQVTHFQKFIKTNTWYSSTQQSLSPYGKAFVLTINR